MIFLIAYLLTSVFVTLFICYSYNIAFMKTFLLLASTGILLGVLIVLRKIRIKRNVFTIKKAHY